MSPGTKEGFSDNSMARQTDYGRENRNHDDLKVAKVEACSAFVQLLGEQTQEL